MVINLIIYRGDTPTYEIQFTDEDDNPIDLTDVTVYFTARKNTPHGELLFDKTCTAHNPTKGIVRVTLSSTDTNYVGNAIGEFEGRYVDGSIITLGQVELDFIKDVRVT